MKTFIRILKATVIIAIIGGALYAFPIFVYKTLLVIVLAGIALRLLLFRGFYRGRYMHKFAFPGGESLRGNFQNWTEEDRREFFSKMKARGCGRFYQEKRKATGSENSTSEPEKGSLDTSSNF